MSECMDSIKLKGLKTDCVVGLYPSERTKQQSVIVDVELFFDTRPAGRGGGLGCSVDYARLSGELRFLLERCRFYMLEEAAEAMAAYVLTSAREDAPRAQVERVRIEIKKPMALDDYAVPSVCIERRRAEYQLTQEVQPFGTVDIVFETSRYGIYLLNIAPGKTIDLHMHREMEEHELVMSDGLLLQGEPVLAGMAHAWPKEFAHGYHNPTDGVRSILCIDRPKFIPDDEIPVTSEPGSLSEVRADFFYPREQAS